MTIDRIIYDTPEKVIAYGLRKIIREQETILAEYSEHNDKLLKKITTLSAMLIGKDNRIILLCARLDILKKKTVKPIEHKIKKMRGRTDKRIKEYQAELRRTKYALKAKIRYIDAIKLYQNWDPSLPTRRCRRCNLIKHHTRRGKYCQDCWATYPPMLAAQKRYEEKHKRPGTHNGIRQRVLK